MWMLGIEPLEEQPVPLTTEPSLQPGWFWFVCCFKHSQCQISYTFSLYLLFFFFLLNLLKLRSICILHPVAGREPVEIFTEYNDDGQQIQTLKRTL